MLKSLSIYKVSLFILFTFLCLCQLPGQKFDAGLLIGFNASQIRGDELAGFDKLGLNVGITANYPISEKSELNIDLLYSQRGSQREIIQNQASERQFVLNYAAVPITISFKDWYISVEDFYRLRFTAGIAYGRLLFSSVNGFKKGENADVDKILDAYRTNDVSWILGAAYFFNDRTGVKARYTRSVFPVLDISDNPDAFTNDLLPFHLTFQLVYLL